MKNKYGLVLLAGAALSVGSFFVGKSRGYEQGLSSGKPSQRVCEVCMPESRFRDLVSDEHWIGAKRYVSLALQECIDDLDRYGYLSVNKEAAARKYLENSGLRGIFIGDSESLEEAELKTRGYPWDRVEGYMKGEMPPVHWGNNK